MAETLKAVKMRVRQKDLDNLDFIQQVYGLDNGATAAATAISIARMIAERVHGQNRLMVHNGDGSVTEIQIPGSR